jgi:hypothetical protein
MKKGKKWKRNSEWKQWKRKLIIFTHKENWGTEASSSQLQYTKYSSLIERLNSEPDRVVTPITPALR